ncbi:hypothetical protein CSQ87_03405 [Bifidobacterium simiarum]|uniref:Uncharacterized protein n=1 Tax=Bifidobacterium simiarum TaxID=2045441 RepID=A0A2M9HGF7_9BIFI|nr:hypothetical protein CSQ87_03405 [Bifidobacterium simiarum]
MTVMRDILREERHLLGASDHPVCWITVGKSSVVMGEPWNGKRESASPDGLYLPDDRMVHIPFPLFITRKESSRGGIRPSHIDALSETVTTFCMEHGIPCSERPFDNVFSSEKRK